MNNNNKLDKITNGYDLPPIKWNRSSEELRNQKFKCRQRITFKCKDCGREVTYAFNVIKSKRDLLCKGCHAKIINLEKYGADNPSKVKEFQDKKLNTFRTKYGVDNTSQLPENRLKAKQTMNERYGDYYTRTEDYRIRSEKTSIERYGTRIGSMSERVKAETKQRNLKKYGYESPSQVPEKIEKAKNTFIKNYGVSNPSYVEEVKEKRVQSSLKKFGVPYASQNNEIKEKIRNTNLERYGETCFMKTQAFKDHMHDFYRPNFLRKLDLYKEEFEPLFDPEKDYKGMDVLYKFRCKTCNQEFETSLDGSYRLICPNCKDKGRSEKEKELTSYVHSIYNGEIITNDRSILNPYELDIYLPEKNLAFEFDGNYWHSEYQLNRKINAKNYHQIKSLKCREKGIHLIHIFEYEWDDPFERVKLCNYIDFVINGSKTRIYARDCEVKEISNDECYQFLEDNHLQSSCASKIRLGLYYNDELVEVMTFSKPRFNKKYEWELSRLCGKNEYSAIGGPSKLLRYFENKFNPSSIISYCDISKMRGNVYKALGFELKEITSPNYNWVKNNLVLNRYSTQKKKLLEQGFQGNTEDEIMISRGFFKIYDSGNEVYVKEYGE